MPQINLKERAHLSRYTFLQEILINILKHVSHSSIDHQEQLFHRTFITGYFRPVNTAKFSPHPVTASVFFKKVLFKSYFATLL